MDVGLSQRGFLAGAGNADIINDLGGAGSSGHASGRAFVLANGGSAFPGDNTSLHVETKTIFADFGFLQFGADGGFQLGIADAPIRLAGDGFA